MRTIMKKVAVNAIIISQLLATNAQAWLIDGKNYLMLNAGFSNGIIEEEKVTSQNIALELGRRTTNDLYVSFIGEYIVYDIEKNDKGIEIDVKASTVALKMGYTPTETTLMYGLIGLVGKSSEFGPMFGTGLRWDIAEHLSLFGEYRRTSVSSSLGDNDTYTITSTTGGVQLYLRY